MCGGGVGGEQKEGKIYLKSEWWSEGGRDTGSTGSFQEELDEGFIAEGCVCGKGEWGQRGRALENCPITSSRDNILAAVMCHETTQGLYGCPISERLMKLQMRGSQAGFLSSCKVAIFAVTQCAQKVKALKKLTDMIS